MSVLEVQTRRTRERTLLACGVALVALGLATQEWVVTHLWADPAFLETLERRIAFRILCVGGLLIGATLILARAAIVARLLPLLAAGITLAAVLGLFLAVDLFLGYRLMSPERKGEKPADVHDWDQHLGWVLRPGAVGRHSIDRNFDVEYRIDAEGFRETPEKGSPQRHFWIFGDSYTFGFGVENEEAWPAVMARRYIGPRDGLINVGVSGYGLIQMYGRLQDVSSRLESNDVVVFAPTAGDLQRNLHDFQHLSQLLYASGAEDLRYPRFEDGELRGVAIDSPWNRIRALFLHALISEGLFRFVNRAITAPASITEGHAILAAAAGICAERGVEFVLVFLPKVKEIWRGRYEVDLSSFDYLDLRRFFPEDDEALGRLRFPTNAHWNREGHDVAARAVSRALREASILKAPAA